MALPVNNTTINEGKLTPNQPCENKVGQNQGRDWSKITIATTALIGLSAVLGAVYLATSKGFENPEQKQDNTLSLNQTRAIEAQRDAQREHLYYGQLFNQGQYFYSNPNRETVKETIASIHEEVKTPLNNGRTRKIKKANDVPQFTDHFPNFPNKKHFNNPLQTPKPNAPQKEVMAPQKNRPNFFRNY